MNGDSSTSPNKIRRIAALTTAAVFGLLAGIGLLLTVAVLRNHKSLPKLEPDDFHQAKQRWEANPLPSYNVEVVVTGRQAATYYVEVRDGEVFAATRDGDVLTQRRTMGTWSVPGMLTTIHSDVINLEKHAAGTADRQTPQVLLHGLFDEQYGFPQRYHRTELRKWGPNQEVMWEVNRFEVVGPEQIQSP